MLGISCMLRNHIFIGRKHKLEVEIVLCRLDRSRNIYTCAHHVACVPEIHHGVGATVCLQKFCLAHSPNDSPVCQNNVFISTCSRLSALERVGGLTRFQMLGGKATACPAEGVGDQTSGVFFFRFGEWLIAMYFVDHC